MSQNFELNLSLILAHTLWFERHEEHLRLYGDTISWSYARNGDNEIPTTQESMASIMQAIVQNLPTILATTNSQIVPNELAKFQAQQQLAPQQAALDQQIFQQFGPAFAQTGRDIQRSNAISQAETERDVLAGPGQDLVKKSVETARIADPEFYNLRESAASQIQKMLEGGLGAGEEEAIRRSVGRDRAAIGTEGVDTNFETARNATLFGGAARNRLSEAINLATQAAPAFRSGTDVFRVATGRPSTSNIGESKIPGVAPIGDSTQNFGAQLMGNVFGLEGQTRDLEANKRDIVDRINESIGSLPSCCFIFMEAYNGPLPWWIRKARDSQSTPETIAGYKWMARWLVPLMIRSTFIKSLVNELMIMPLSSHAGYLYSVEGYSHGKVYHRYRDFWLGLWKYIGRKLVTTKQP